MVEKASPPVRDSQRIRIGFFETGRSVRPFAEGPFPGFLEPELAEKIFVERAAEETAEGVVIGCDQPVFPHRNTAIAVGIDVTFGRARDFPTDLENLGFVAWIEIG
ncbi:hypothetical protein GCM10023232_15470 [Sphingosinicella ginsenosidimutans]|uniref:Uncharacterized protein n=1 Tax=Allosphingosinicella ginsenosidimutans TaxID=1176539 RepID=A0A5C6TRH7_9SPHN|nr:hypothetical protein [Sphingosinicella ginsenosidimutans]TXC62621.1 hypothetical protein FRZ32_02465 [Sphingosinicella ginsenosidimutans]